jgi:hypothetical protein
MLLFEILIEVLICSTMGYEEELFRDNFYFALSKYLN